MADHDVKVDSDIVPRLRAAIMKGVLLPNERLVEVELAKSFGTNRANIRTALAVLEQQRLVVREPNRGARVHRISNEEALEIAQARRALEVLVARQAAVRAGAEDRKRLKKVMKSMQDALKAGDLSTLSNLNGVLHADIQAIAKNATLARLLEGLRSGVVRIQYQSIFFPGRAEESVAEHRELVTAISTNDPERAESAMGRHLDRVLDNLEKIMSSQALPL